MQLQGRTKHLHPLHRSQTHSPSRSLILFQLSLMHLGLTFPTQRSGCDVLGHFLALQAIAVKSIYAQYIQLPEFTRPKMLCYKSVSNCAEISGANFRLCLALAPKISVQLETLL